MRSSSGAFLDVPNFPLSELAQPETESPPPRRVLIASKSAAGAALRQQLASAGYEAHIALAGYRDLFQAIAKFNPDVVLIELERKGDENERIAVVRHLRAEPATYALPIVLLFHKDERSLRNAALSIGVDDYFPLATPPVEIRARLDALFWRAEAGRRAAPVVNEQRAEIDNFLHVFDSMAADLDGGAIGALALVEAVRREEDFRKDAQSHTLREAHGFLKLNLRRMDAVAFYGPMTLLVYLPRYGKLEAYSALTRLREEFLETRPDSDIAIGIVSFPRDGNNIENLIIKAEEAVDMARSHTAQERVITHQSSNTAGETIALSEHRVQPTRKPEMPRQADNEYPTPPELPIKQVVRETRRADSMEISMTPLANVEVRSSKANASTLSAAEAAARERERRARGEIMPRRILLTVSDAARMAQINLLIRSAGYEVRAAFDGGQAVNLLRIERHDLLLLDYELNGIDGMEALRRLYKQGGGRLPLPVVLFLPAQHESVRREALELGVRSIIRLPYDPVELLDSMRLSGRVE